MAFKQFELDGVGKFTVYKRRGTNSLRITITGAGKVRVSQPSWLPYSAGVKFAAGKAAWLQKELSKRVSTAELLQNGMVIGKQHRLLFEPAGVSGVKTRVTDNQVRVLLPIGMVESDPKAQQAARSSSERALRRESEQLLAARLDALAGLHGFEYAGLTIKKLRGRWGSCSSDKRITLNLFLVQLPWHLIDYVLLHELVHTHHMNHSAAFWTKFEHILPGAKRLRKNLHEHQPTLLTQVDAKM